MASREEEKRLRREEREKAEAAAASSQARGKRLQFLIGALVTIAVVVGVVLAVSGGGGDDMGSTGSPSDPPENVDATIPPVKERNLEKAVAAAKCKVSSPTIEGSTHVDEKVEYQTSPPTSGNHNAQAALDGIYEAGNEPEPENYVHALEHGRVVVQYKAGSTPELVSQLEAVVSEELNAKAGYKTLLLQNNTKMEAAVVATAWGQMLTCDTPSDAMFDALRAFRVQYVDKGPENIPPTN